MKKNCINHCSKFFLFNAFKQYSCIDPYTRVTSLMLIFYRIYNLTVHYDPQLKAHSLVYVVFSIDIGSPKDWYSVDVVHRNPEM